MAGADLSLPLGICFSPTDYEALYYYLVNKAYGRALPFNEIPEIDFYSFDPDQLSKVIPIDESVRGAREHGYFFTYNHKNCTERIRWTSKGYWKSIGADEEIEHKDEVIGYKKNFIFHWDKSADGTKGNYIMTEYRLNPSLNADDSNTRKNIEHLLLWKVQKRDPNIIYVPRVGILEEESDSSDEEETHTGDTRYFRSSLSLYKAYQLVEVSVNFSAQETDVLVEVSVNFSAQETDVLVM